MTQRIQLSQGKWALVDDEDFDWLCQWRWSACEKRKGFGEFYAVRQDRSGDRPRMLTLHRQIMAPGPGEIVDHINGDGLDNRRSNLRICTPSQNQMNRRPSRHKGPRGYKGVTYHKQSGRWVAHFRGKYIGIFPTEDLAAAAYNRAASGFSAEFARLNQIEGVG